MCGNCYYVDSVNGSDTNSGTTPSNPWKTLSPVNAKKFSPGSVISFKRGSSWTGSLVINESGAPGNPITFTAYDTGDRPILRNPGDSNNLTRAVIINANWVIVEGLLVRDTYDAGIKILAGAEHNIVRDNEITNTGLGIQINGQYSLFTHNYVHDLHMVVNTPGGNNDDYGAVAVVLSNASYNEISYNRMVNCIAPSYDFGTDGGAIEWWGNTDGNYVHHNWAMDDNGFLEVGGGSAKDTIVAYNVSINNGIFALVHLTGSFASSVTNFRVENNTIVETGNGAYGWVALGFEGVPIQSTLLARNNILYINRFVAISNMSSFTHDHNLYYLSGGTKTGFTLGQGEKIADPLFVNLASQDLHLQPTSPAIDAGVNLGYTLDFDDHPVPIGAAPDDGAFEFQGAP
jgi:hypothetical protein